ncbi:MAG: aldo/keto reductase [Caldilineaceae bacterium]|nr:aldo/keto reductase [Caldilineaceae bacterium]
MAITFALPNFGMGCAPLGGDGGVFGMASDAAADATVQHALAHGVTFFDTAPLYGSGVSETRLGRALAGVPRDQYQIATKIGVVINADGSTTRSYYRDAVKRSVEDSLRRLNVDYVEIAHIHDADPEINLRIALDEAYPVLADFKAQGVIRAIGAGMNYWEPEAEMARNADFDCFLLAGRYTLLEQDPIHEYLPLCLEKEISVFLGGVFNTGILATGSIPAARYQYRPAPPPIMEKTRRIEAVCARYDVALKAAALQFPLAHPAVRSLVVGMISAGEMDQNLAALHAPIPADFWAELRARALIDPAAPTPKPTPNEA